MSAIRVLKYEIPSDPGTHMIPMPLLAHVLSVGLDPAGRLCLWAAVDIGYDTLPDIGRCVVVAFTGHSDVGGVMNSSSRFIGTVVNTVTGIVVHVWAAITSETGR